MLEQTKMKKIYKVSEPPKDLFDDDIEHFFTTKKLALFFLKKEILRRELNLDKHGFPDRDIYDTPMENKIGRMLKNKEWLKLAPIYQLYLKKVELIDK